MTDPSDEHPDNGASERMAIHARQLRFIRRSDERRVPVPQPVVLERAGFACKELVAAEVLRLTPDMWEGSGQMLGLYHRR